MLPLKPPALKTRKCKNIKLINFPIFDENGKTLDNNSWPKFQGIFNGKAIIVNDLNDISRLRNMGSFGQYGKFDKNKFIDSKTIENQMLKQNNYWQEIELVPFEFPNSNKNNDVIVNDITNSQSIEELKTIKEQMHQQHSDETFEEFIKRIQTLKWKKQEHTQEEGMNSQAESITSDNVVTGTAVNWSDLKTNYSKEFNKLLITSGHVHDLSYYLLLEEAFFLCYTLECLDIQEENGSTINVHECWKCFNSLKKDFAYSYAVYHYYRSKEWVVKPGWKYGGEYVLYKSLPTYYHSSFVVIISINGQNSESLSSWPSWFGCSRAIENANKDLILCTVHGPAYEQGMSIDLTKYTVNDTIIRRWVPSQNRIKLHNRQNV